MAYIGLTNILTKVGGQELTLDIDEDTSLTADSDDQIDVRIAGADDFQFTANTFSVLTGSSQKFADSAKGLFGTGDDLEIYHDGTNSYIANKTGALKVATETSGIVVTIGHTTSETTIADNLTVTGNASIGGNLDVTGSFDMSDADITNIGSIALDSITNDGTDITLDSSNDIVIDAAGGNVEFKDAGTLQLTLDMDGTSGAQVIQLGVDSDDLVFNQYDGNEVMRIADDRAVYFFDKGGEKISSDGTDFTFNSGNDINLTATTDINVPANVGITFGDDGEKIEGNGTDLTINASADLNLTATTDINIPANVGLTFGDDAEKIEGDGTDLTIAGNNIKLTAATDVIIPTNVGLHFTDANEKIESNGTDLTINAGADINLTATTDINVPANVGITFGDDGEKIEGDGTDLTIAGNNINLTATADVVIPNNVGIQFGGASEKIEGDGTDLTISANNLTVDAAADIILDAAGNDFQYKAGGTHIFSIVNSSSDVIMKPIADTKDLIFQQRDGTEVMRIEDGAHASFAAAAVNPEATLSDGANVAWNVLTSPVAKVTLAGNRNLSAGSGGITGQFISLLVIQDGTGSRTLTFNAVYEFKDDEAPTLTTTAAKGDLFVFRYNGSKFLEVGRNQNLTLS